ncbi:hypothetical protein [Stutzerimonas nosocomialis]|uniref:hypothetical protein n=1 Tax=Stutzerimonas nosocomialis TaxID=1056496 RepID=UPI00110806A2|nr:hypothetical protein [Stutzerimonas nosocomialis]
MRQKKNSDLCSVVGFFKFVVVGMAIIFIVAIAIEVLSVVLVFSIHRVIAFDLIDSLYFSAKSAVFVGGVVGAGLWITARQHAARNVDEEGKHEKKD